MFLLLEAAVQAAVLVLVVVALGGFFLERIQ
jgi:hypothetical protein